MGFGRRLLPLLASSLLVGCSYRFALESDPAGAMVSVDGVTIGATPIEVSLPYRPFFMEGHEVRVVMPGYTPMPFDVTREVRGGAMLWRGVRHPMVAVGLAPPARREVLLIPVERGAAE